MELDTFYIPQYGVERANQKGVVGAFNPNGVGADETNDNLLVTLWGLSDSVIGSPADPGYTGIVAPSYLDTSPFAPDTWALGDEDHAPGFAQAMKGRVGCKYYVNQTDESKPATGLLHVLNPPQEYRQQLANAVLFNGGDPTNLANYTFKKSMQGSAWEASGVVGPGFGLNGYLSVDPSALVTYSTYLDLMAGPMTSLSPVPLLKTNGADGVPPEFFDRTTAAGVQEMIAAVNLGNFYVALIYGGGVVSSTGFITLKWPHSIARG